MDRPSRPTLGRALPIVGIVVCVAAAIGYVLFEEEILKALSRSGVPTTAGRFDYLLDDGLLKGSFTDVTAQAKDDENAWAQYNAIVPGAKRVLTCNVQRGFAIIGWEPLPAVLNQRTSAETADVLSVAFETERGQAVEKGTDISFDVMEHHPTSAFFVSRYVGGDGRTPWVDFGIRCVATRGYALTAKFAVPDDATTKDFQSQIRAELQRIRAAVLAREGPLAPAAMIGPLYLPRLKRAALGAVMALAIISVVFVALRRVYRVQVTRRTRLYLGTLSIFALGLIAVNVVANTDGVAPWYAEELSVEFLLIPITTGAVFVAAAVTARENLVYAALSIHLSMVLAGAVSYFLRSSADSTNRGNALAILAILYAFGATGTLGRRKPRGSGSDGARGDGESPPRPLDFEI